MDNPDSPKDSVEDGETPCLWHKMLYTYLNNMDFGIKEYKRKPKIACTGKGYIYRRRGSLEYIRGRTEQIIERLPNSHMSHHVAFIQCAPYC
jgi:hypothetical protein